MELIFFILVLNLYILGCVVIIKTVTYLEKKYNLSFGLCIIILVNLVIFYGAGLIRLIFYIIDSLKEVN